MDGDGNLAALAKYEEEINKEEIKYDRFTSSFLTLYQSDYENMKTHFDLMAEDWGYNITFEEFMEQNI